MTSVSTDRRYGVTGSVAIKTPCKTATTANITLSGEQTIDGVACTSGDRVLVKDQTTASENGIYEVNTSDWRREPDFDGSRDVVEGTLVFSTDGSTTKGYWRVTTSDPIVPGTTSLAFEAADVDSVLRNDLASTTNGAGKGFHLIYIERTDAEVSAGITPTNYEYPELYGKRYGIPTDGTTDSSTAINNALSVANAKGGGNVVLPFVSGGYSLSTKLTMYDGVGLVGESLSHFTTSGSIDTTLRLKPDSSLTIVVDCTDVTSILLQDFQIDFTNAGTTCEGVVIDGVQHSSFRRVSVDQASLAGHTGWSIKETNRGNYWNTVEQCKSRAYPSNLGTGFKLRGNPPTERINQFTFISCNAFDHNNGWDFDGIGAGITLINCTGESCGNDGLVITDVTYAGAPNIIGGEFSNNGGYGVNGFAYLLNTALSGNSSGATANGACRQFLDDTSGNYLHLQYGFHAWDYSLKKLEKTITAASDTINTDGYGIVSLVGDAAYTMTSTPTLEAGKRDGQKITLTSQFPGSNYITIQDEGTLTGSGIYLKGGGKKSLTSLQSIDLYWRASNSKWYECGGNQFGAFPVEGAATYNPPSLADGAGVTTTVTATGAALGDFTKASFSLDLQGITLTSWVSAADTVSVRFQNESGGVLDLGSGTLKVQATSQ